jgi:hypothetical protein
MRSFLFFCIFIIMFNELAFLFYNYSWFSLFCSTYIIDFYNIFYFFYLNLTNICHSSIVYLLVSIDELSFIFQNRWFVLIETIYNNSFQLLFYISINNKYELVDCIYCIYFDTKVIGNTNIYFYILQNKLFIVPGETTLCFFRIYNENQYTISGVTIYNITPYELQIFINKIQCFCFEELTINAYEIIELPVLFYLHSNVMFLNTNQIKELCIEYVLLCRKII